MADYEFVTHRQYDSMLKRIERENIKRHRRSLSFASMAGRVNDLIVDCREEGVLVVKGWRDEMRRRLLIPEE